LVNEGLILRLSSAHVAGSKLGEQSCCPLTFGQGAQGPAADVTTQWAGFERCRQERQHFHQLVIREAECLEGFLEACFD
jgi:hypothetical protein